MSNEHGRFLIVMGLAIMIAAYSPDKNYGLSLGLGIILIGVCSITSNIDWAFKEEDEL